MFDQQSADEQTSIPFLFGTRIGPYDIGRRLGAGEMGAVYEATRRDDGSPVAIKVLTGSLAAKPRARERFLHEAKLTARVRHPNIVNVIEAGEESETTYLAMELLEGEDLARHLRRFGAMSAGEAAEVFVPVCDAVATAHRHGIIHRDLKPSNIFLARKAGRTHPTVLDFGIAQAEEGADVQEGSFRGMFGTPMYLAPELIGLDPIATPSSDQYALGVSLYEALTGFPPFRAADFKYLWEEITAGHPPAPRQSRPDLPAELEQIVQRAMSRDPGERYPSVSDLGLALLPFIPATAGTRGGRRRPPSSPAIEAEAATPSPFVRTLPPEALAAPEEIDGDDTVPSEHAPEDESQDESAPSIVIAQPNRRRRYIATAGVAAAGIALLCLLGVRRSVPTHAPSPPPAAAAPAPRQAPAAVIAAPPLQEKPAPPLDVAPATEAPPPAPTPAPAPAPAPRPRHRENPAVRMHNGVPLLD